MGKNLLLKIAMGKSPNEMGNCPFAYPLVAPLYHNMIHAKEKNTLSHFTCNK
jgi:hypothetical protein